MRLPRSFMAAFTLYGTIPGSLLSPGKPPLLELAISEGLSNQDAEKQYAFDGIKYGAANIENRDAIRSSGYRNSNWKNHSSPSQERKL
jgi:hypothetical protein